MKEKLRIALLVDDYTIPAWAFKMLERIQNNSISEIVLIVKKKSESKHQPFLKKLLNRRKALAYIVLRRLEKIFFKVSPDAFEKKNLKDLQLINLDELEVSTIEKKFSDYVSKKDIETIKEYKIDVCLRLGFRILRGEILSVAKYGIWSYHHGDNNVNRGGPAGAWEVLKGWKTTGVVLQILTEDLDSGYIMARSTSTTDKYSIRRNQNISYWKALSFVPRKLQELYDLGGQQFMQNLEQDNSQPTFYSERLFVEPGNWIVFKHIVKTAVQILAGKISGIIKKDQWVLLYRIEQKPKLSRSFFRFKELIPPSTVFWADPHVIERNDRYYVFMEEYVYKTKKGHISCFEMDGQGNVTKPKIILEKDYHLSYPFIFEDKGEVYMIPETFGNQTIDLYRSTNFPYEWSFEMSLMQQIRAVDATIFFWNNRYWLFANVLENTGASTRDELFLYYSTELKSQTWISHPQNPIVSDVANARPAGKIFMYENKIYRPAQNSTGGYGYGMQINQIVQLDENEYREEGVSTILPNWSNKITATHCISHAGKLTVIDGLRRRTL